MKINWGKVNPEKYQDILQSKLDSLHEMQFVALGEKLEYISDSLKEAAFKAAPWRGPRFKASPVVKNLLKLCKETHTKWKEYSSPGPDSVFYVKRKEAKQHLRRQLRKENYLKKETFYSELMQNADTKTFYKLIKMNQSNRANSSTRFIVNGKSILDPVSQRMNLKNYYEDLAIPKDDIVFDDEYLQHSEMHIELIHELKRQGRFKPTEAFTEREIESSIKQLKIGKAADEFGLSAEHLKTSGEVIIPILKDIFNEVMRT